jgi:hypothetical protein
MVKLSVLKLNANELSLISSAIEQVTVKGRDCIVVAKTIEKLDRAKEKLKSNDDVIPKDMRPLEMPTNGAQMSKAE